MNDIYRRSILASVFVFPLISATSFAGEPITIGALLPLTGPGSVIGNLERDGIQFAVDQYNAKGGIEGRTIKLITDDHQAKPVQAVLDYKRMVDLGKVQAMLSSYSGPTLAIAPLATRQKIVLINAGAQADSLEHASPYLFNTTPMINDEIGVLVNYLIDHHHMTAAILYENDSAGISGKDDFVSSFEKAGGKITGTEPTNFGETNFRPDILKLASGKPDVLFVNLTAGTKKFADQNKELNTPFVVVGTSFFSDPTLIRDPASDGWIHTQVDVSAPPMLADEFQRKFNAPMSFHVRQWYNGTTVLLDAITYVVEQKQDVTGQNIRSAIFKVKNFHGLIPMQFNSNTASVKISINRIADGRDTKIAEGVTR